MTEGKLYTEEEVEQERRKAVGSFVRMQRSRGLSHNQYARNEDLVLALGYFNVPPEYILEDTSESFTVYDLDDTLLGKVTRLRAERKAYDESLLEEDVIEPADEDPVVEEPEEPEEEDPVVEESKDPEHNDPDDDGTYPEEPEEEQP